MEDISISRPDQRMRRREASAYLKAAHGLDYKPNTLAKLAVVGGGPEMQYVGRFPYYTPERLDRWANSKTMPPVFSTAERNAHLNRATQVAA